MASENEMVNAMCPVTIDEPIDPYITTKYKGQTIGLCCRSCLRKFNANPEAYLKNLSLWKTDSTSLEQSQNVNNSLPASGHPHTAPEKNVFLNELSSALGVPAKSQEHHHGHHDSGYWQRTVVLLGKFHVLVVHLPIALLTVAAVLEIIGHISHRTKWLFVARVNYVIGSVFAVIAAIFGWIAASQASYPGELEAILSWHRWLGVSVAVIALCGLLSIFAECLECDWGKPFYRISLFTLAVLVPITAHFGGSLIYGSGYLTF